MYVDAVTTAAVASALNETIIDGRVQAVIAVDDQSVGLEVYARQQRHYLLLSIHPKEARCQLVGGKLRRGAARPSPLVLLMKKYIEGSRLMSIHQPAWERLLQFEFSGDEGNTRLIAETMDKRSNLILTVDGHILECMKRIGADQNRYRQILPGKPYIPPPPQSKALPAEVGLGQIKSYLEQDPDQPTWRLLVQYISGISPLLAKEIIFRACGDAEALAFDVAARIVHEAFSKLIGEVLEERYFPCVALAPDRPGYLAFAAYQLNHLGWKPVDSIFKAMTLYFGAPVGQDAYTAGKQPIQDQIDEALTRVHHKLDSLERESSSDEEIERLRQHAELILAYGPTFKPGQTSFQAQYDPDGPMLDIPLDPALTHVENAQKLFERYDKAKRAVKGVPRFIAETRHEIAYLNQLAADLQMAESWPDIDIVREALQEAGYWRGAKTRGPRGGKPGIRRFTEGDGFVILVGRNADQNHTLVTERSASRDLWLHARGIPGSHVIVKNDGRPIPEEVIQRAAELAAYYSAGRDDSAVEVDVTERRYVRPIKGGRPGMVNYKNERTLRIAPQD
ncbi:MAG: NFACT family protein [Anaerolineae bacterium]|nr:NFACT family protein [Anaerolineae bacterium]